MCQLISFGYIADYRTTAYGISNRSRRSKMPFLFTIKRRYRNTASDVGAAFFTDLFERTLDAVVNTADQTGTQFN